MWLPILAIPFQERVEARTSLSSLGLEGASLKGDVYSSVINALRWKAEYMIKTDVLDVMPSCRRPLSGREDGFVLHEARSGATCSAPTVTSSTSGSSPWA